MTYPDGLHHLIRVEEEKDLGVLFSSTLKFSYHTKEIVHKANRLIEIIKRTLKFLEPQMLRNLCTALIRPHLDYACVIWNPYELGVVRTLIRVQRSTSRASSPLRHLPYIDQLIALLHPSFASELCFVLMGN